MQLASERGGLRRQWLLALSLPVLLSACGTLTEDSELTPQAVSGEIYEGPINLRDGPGTNYSVVGSVNTGDTVSIACHSYGTSHTGPWGTSDLWDKLSNGTWVSDAFVYTGSNGPVAPWCSSSGGEVIGDDYPYKNASMDGVDPWNFYNRQCTSFAAWRIVETKDSSFNNYYGGVRWGNANNWDNAARVVGIPVSSTPTVDSIAVWEGGTYGHVAYVAKVNSDGSIVVEDYNFNYDGRYSTRTITASSPSSYIHF